MDRSYYSTLTKTAAPVYFRRILNPDGQSKTTVRNERFVGESGANLMTSGAADEPHVGRLRRLPVRHCCRMKPRRAGTASRAKISVSSSLDVCPAPGPLRQTLRSLLSSPRRGETTLWTHAGHESAEILAEGGTVLCSPAEIMWERSQTDLLHRVMGHRCTGWPVTD